MNILVVYADTGSQPMRETTKAHLFFLNESRTARVFYLNAFYPTFFKFLFTMPIDLIIYTSQFCSLKWAAPEYLQKVRQNLEPIKRIQAPRAIMPQDEFYNMMVLSDFINDFEIDYVFSVAPESEWPKIYPKVNRKRTQFYRTLTGYLSDKLVHKLNTWPPLKRDIDIGYRAWEAEYWIGKQGILKVKVGQVFKDIASQFKLKVDISNQPEDTFHGEDWYHFLRRCRYTVGAESGATVLDMDGSICDKTRAFIQKAHDNGESPSYEETETACFPNLDGQLNLVALGPRHLEACATRTCQILVEGHYNGILKPNIHYIPLKADFSNVEEVAQRLNNEEERLRIVNQAYQDIVASNQFNYAALSRFIYQTCLGNPNPARRKVTLKQSLQYQIYVWNYRKLCFYIKLKQKVRTYVSPEFINAIRRFISKPQKATKNGT